MILFIEWAIKTSLISALAFGASWFMRRSSASRRHLVWVGAFCAIALLPLCTVLIPASLHSNLPSAELQYSSPVVPVEVFAEEPPSVRAPVIPISWPALIWLVGCLASAA